jgi:hypothetical protein
MLPDATIYTFSSSGPEKYSEHIIHTIIKYDSEPSIEAAATIASERSPLDLVIVATGILHDGQLMPEKSLKDLSAEKLFIYFLLTAFCRQSLQNILFLG